MRCTALLSRALTALLLIAAQAPSISAAESPEATPLPDPVQAQEAQRDGEQLIAPPPPDWIVGGRANDGDLRVLEFVPQATLPRAGDERILIESSRLDPLPDPGAFLRSLAREAHSRCPSLRASEMSARDENGYRTSVWLFDCPVGPGNGLPLQMFKAIRGDDWFYVIERSSKHADTRPDGVAGERVRIGEWAQYMRGVSLCNLVRPDHPCPRPEVETRVPSAMPAAPPESSTIPPAPDASSTADPAGG